MQGRDAAELTGTWNFTLSQPEGVTPRRDGFWAVKKTGADEYALRWLEHGTRFYVR